LGQPSALRTHGELALENLALRQQLAVWKARQPRPRLTKIDRIFWVLLSRLRTSWRHSLLVVPAANRSWLAPARVSANEVRQSSLGRTKDPR
jgi:hypothetical protein